MGSSVAPVAWPDVYDAFTSLEEDFTPRQVDAMAIAPHHSVLDLGCGSGRLTIPLATRAGRVTAVDTSSALLGKLRAKARGAGLCNITTVRADWQDVEPRLHILRHDIVVAARFRGADDLMKLDAAARERVYVLMFSGPSTRALHAALLQGIRPPPPPASVPRPGFARVFSELCDLGVDPNVIHIPGGYSRWYANADAATEDFAWLGVEERHWFNLRRNVEMFLAPEGEGVRFLFPTRNTLIWWQK